MQRAGQNPPTTTSATLKENTMDISTLMQQAADLGTLIAVAVIVFTVVGYLQAIKD